MHVNSKLTCGEDILLHSLLIVGLALINILPVKSGNSAQTVTRSMRSQNSPDVIKWKNVCRDIPGFKLGLITRLQNKLHSLKKATS